jgi:hypothetical protein
MRTDNRTADHRWTQAPASCRQTQIDVPTLRPCDGHVLHKHNQCHRRRHAIQLSMAPRDSPCKSTRGEVCGLPRAISRSAVLATSGACRRERAAPVRQRRKVGRVCSRVHYDRIDHTSGMSLIMPQPMRRAMLPAVLIAAAAFAVSTAHAAATPRFPPSMPWYSDISKDVADPASDRMIGASMSGANGKRIAVPLKIDFTLHVLDTAATPVRRVPLRPSDGYYRPDCDTGFDIPLPEGGAIESSESYRCDLHDNDCHLLVIDGNTLYEGFQTTVDAEGAHALCVVRWKLDRVYPETGRGDQCTSADAAGFPIAPLTFNADEVAEASRNGTDLGHALRFILPNASMRAGVYVRPATHAGAPKNAGDAIPYGARLRLKEGVAIERFNPAAEVVLRTLRRYGAFVADGGTVPLTAQSDRFTKTKWNDLELGENTLRSLTLEAFEVMPIGPLHELTYACRRNDAP